MFNLVYVFDNIDFSRAGLLTGCNSVVVIVEVKQSLGHGFNFHNVFGADLFACTASDTFDFVDDRITIRSDYKCIKSACLDTITKAQTANRAFVLSPWPIVP